ncbi:hypothetical protein L3X38_035117 [Prunus dulcis]|uniref:Uncharacterized protein n=1 Tax=Prunus dulcis TaxID=3755 RepID=A0AAD4VJA5_PRUDU|nr:hypothetical protein L3X38_035117 [Prunus dulcis]
MAIFARNFAGSDLPPPAAISGDQGETLPNFRQKVPVFSEWARHRGDVRNPKGFISKYGKIRGGSFHLGNGGNTLPINRHACIQLKVVGVNQENSQLREKNKLPKLSNVEEPINSPS